MKTKPDEETAPPFSGRQTQLSWRLLTLFLLTVLVLIVSWLIATPFLSAIVGAATLAVVTFRPYRWLETWTKRPTFAAALGVLAVTLSVITPLFFLLEELGGRALSVANLLRTGEPQQRLTEILQRHPTIAARLESAARRVDLEQASESAARYVAAHLAGLLGNTFGAFTQLVLMIFILFFLYRDHRIVVASLKRLLPVDDLDKDLILGRISDAIYATALGRVAVGLIQGFLAGLAFWVIGLNSPVFWGLLSALVAVVPAVGPALIWLPVAICLALTGHWIKACLLIGWGGFVVGTIDNLLYPLMVGSRLRQHPVVILISVIGGIAVFGVPGLILGPSIFTLAEALLDVWSSKSFVSV